MRIRSVLQKSAFSHGASMESDLNNPSPPRDADYYQLDRRLTVLETRFDTILPTLATKTDLVELKSQLKTLLIVVILGFATLSVTTMAMAISLFRH
jgi:hypothetical protein